MFALQPFSTACYAAVSLHEIIRKKPERDILGSKLLCHTPKPVGKDRFQQAQKIAKSQKGPYLVTTEVIARNCSVEVNLKKMKHFDGRVLRGMWRAGGNFGTPTLPLSWAGKQTLLDYGTV